MFSKRVAWALSALLFSVPASADVLQATASLEVRVGSLPFLSLEGEPVNLSVSSGTGAYTLPAGLIQGTTTFSVGLFTGVTLISTWQLMATNQSIHQAGGGFSGGIAGSAVVGVLGGLINLVIPLAQLGGSGVATSAVGALNVTVSGFGGWTTGAAVVTGVTWFGFPVPPPPTPPSTTFGYTKPFSRPTLTQPINTATLSGSDARTPGHHGAMSLVAPVRFMSNAAGNLPVFGVLTVEFVPEVGPLALLGTAAGALAWAASRRLRRPGRRK